MDPVPRHLFLRDVLFVPVSHPEVVEAKAQVLQSKWVKEIVALQREDGSFGYFHTLSNPTKKQPITTEQALRRLLALGLDVSDEPVRRIADYMECALRGEIQTPDRVEKAHSWTVFMPLMLAAWLRRLMPRHEDALDVAHRWTRVMEASFAGDAYDPSRYIAAYEDEFALKLNPKAGRLADFVHFYMLTILKGLLTPDTQRKMLAHVIGHECGIYYILGHVPAKLPGEFRSAETVRYLSALELLAGYEGAGEALAFAVTWLLASRDADGLWDMGPQAKDGVHFPLSDSWRNPGDRAADCSVKILALLRKLTAE